jgi:predicted DNA-binding transcriptional regulator AlpA
MDKFLNTIELSADIWRLEEVSSYLRLDSVKAAYSAVKAPGFPTPLMGRSRNRRWVAEEVKSWIDAKDGYRLHLKRPMLEASLSPIDIRRKSRGAA